MVAVAYNGHSAEKRNRVGQVTYRKIRSGYWPAPARCVVCGVANRKALQAHCEDYDLPHLYVGICRRDHSLIHRRFSQPDPWLARLDDIDGQLLPGWRVPSFLRRLDMTLPSLAPDEAVLEAAHRLTTAPTFDRPYRQEALL